MIGKQVLQVPIPRLSSDKKSYYKVSRYCRYLYQAVSRYCRYLYRVYSRPNASLKQSIHHGRWKSRKKAVTTGGYCSKR